MANDKKEISWSYDSYQQPRMAIRLKNLDDLEYPNNSEEFCVIDTGNSGGIMLPIKIYKKLELELWELPETETFGLADGNDVEMLVSIGYLMIPEISNEPHPVKFYCSKYHEQDYPEILIGLEFLNKLKLILDGPNQTLAVSL